MKEKPPRPVAPKRRADHYNDKKYNYLRYWGGRDYEKAAEEMAIRRLIKGMHFKHAVDVGGGYGRLCLLLEQHADKVTLTEPSQQQLNLAKKFLLGHPEIERKKRQAAELGFQDGAVDLVTMIRVIHHIPEPSREFGEIARVLSDNGYAIIEVANHMHALNRLRYALKLRRFPLEPVDIRSEEHQKSSEVPFVNHNPYTILKELAHAGLAVERMLSVSNLRNRRLKRLLPTPIMLAIEGMLQPTIASGFFGPSMFFLVRKVK